MLYYSIYVEIILVILGRTDICECSTHWRKFENNLSMWSRDDVFLIEFYKHTQGLLIVIKLSFKVHQKHPEKNKNPLPYLPFRHLL